MNTPTYWFELVPHHEFGSRESNYIWLKSSNGKENRPLMQIDRCDENEWVFEGHCKRIVALLTADIQGKIRLDELK